MKSAGYDAVLVGEALVRSSDPSSLIRELAT
jgi:indole-3-glycerol phosphate synthase